MSFLPGKSFPTNWTHVRLVNTTVMRTNMVGHSVLPFKPLLADGALKRLLIWVGQLVAIEVVHITKCFATHLTPMVFLDGFGGFLDNILLWHITHSWWYHNHACARGHWCGCCRQDANYCGVVGRVAVVFVWYSRNHRYHGGGSLGCFLWSWNHLDSSVAGLVASQVVAVTESFVAVATYKWCFGFVFFLHHRHWWLWTSTHQVIFEDIRSIGRGFLFHLNG